MKVRDIMTNEIESAQPDTPLDEIARKMRAQDVGAIPIVEDGDLVGIVTDRDIVLRCVAEGKDPGDTDVEEILSPDIETISPDDEVERASDIMGRRQIRRLPVVEDGTLVGMIALGDIAVKLPSEEPAAEALENVSEGVRATSPGGRKTASENRPHLVQQRKTDRAQQQKEARGRASQKTTSRGQGISSHNRDEEQRRQSKVTGRNASQKRRAG